MNSIKYFFILLIFILNACSSQSIEGQIKNTIKKEAQFLATMDAVYLLAFINEKSNIIESNDIYMRLDKGTVSYGFNLDKIKIQIIKQGNDKILKVQLPYSQKIAKDRQAISLNNVHDTYRPLDKDGKEIDIESELSKELDRIDQKYGERTAQESRKITEQYFEGLAKKFGFQNAEVEFVKEIS